VAVRAEAQSRFPCPSAATVADPLTRFLIDEHTGVLIVKIAVKRIGPVPQTFSFGSDARRSAPLKVTALKAALTRAAEKTDRSKTSLHTSIRLRPIAKAFNVPPDDGGAALDGRRERI
jgi:hypothetical protein